MKKFGLQINLKNINLFILPLFIKFNLILAQEQYTYPFDNIIELDYPQIPFQNTLKYNLTNCSNQDRKLFFMITYFEKCSKCLFQIIQEEDKAIFTFDKDSKYFYMESAELCMKDVYVYKELIDLKSLSTNLYLYKSKPPNYNKNMKVIPSIIGFEVNDAKKGVGIYFEKFEAQSDGFEFTFFLPIINNIKKIYLNYLYFDENNFNNYLKIDVLYEINYRNKTFTNQQSEIQIVNIPKSYPLIGFYEFEFEQSQLDNINLYLDSSLDQDAFKFYEISYKTQKDQKMKGVTSQIVTFQMIRCNYDPNSKAYINSQDRCVEKCPDGQYQEEDKRRNIIICQNCTQLCKTCLNAFDCLSCQKDQYLYQNKCFDKQPIKSYCNKK